MMKEVKTGVYFKGEESYMFEFATDLSIKDKAKFVNMVVEYVVDATHYNSVIRDLMFDYAVIKFFTNIDTYDFDKSDNFLDDVEDLLYETNIVDIVKENAFPTIFDELNDAVDKSIEYLTGIHNNPLNEALLSLVSAFERKIESFDMNSAMEMASKFNGITDEFTPENIVKAYLQTDVHKKNLDEITEVKENIVDFMDKK